MSIFQDVPPLDWQTPIVDPATGRPTAQFALLWQRLFQNGDFVNEAAAEAADDAASALSGLAAKADKGAVGSSGLTMATSRLLGRTTASTGAVEELTLSQALDLIGSAAQGDILYRGSSGWARLAAGTNGHFLKTLGAGSDPAWASAAGGGDPLFFYAVSTGTSASSSSFATKGMVYDTIDEIEISAVRVQFHSTGTYIVQICSVSGTSVVASLGVSNSVVVSAASRPLFKFSSRVTIPASSRFAICVIRTDSGTTASCNIHFPSVTSAPLQCNYVHAFTVARNVASVASDSVASASTSVTLAFDIFQSIDGVI